MRTTLRMLAVVGTLLVAACDSSSTTANGQAAAGSPADVTAFGSSSQGCLRFLVAGKPPTFANAELNAKTQTLCNRAYVAFYSDVVRTPLWSAEQLTQAGIDARRGIERVDDFHADPRVPSDGPQLSDYRGSGYDRGHLSPDADMPSRDSEQESFALTNIAPQTAILNRGSWASLEKSLRRQARGGPVYIVTGTLFRGKLNATHDDGRVKVPSEFWKAAYAEGRGATVFIATNTEEPKWQNMAVSQFASVYGIDPFPGLDAKYRNVNGALDGTIEGGSTRQRRGRRGGYGAGGNGYNYNGNSNSGSNGSAMQSSDNNLILDPHNGQWIGKRDYQNTYKEDPPQ